MSQTGIFFRYYICRRFLALYMKSKIFMKVLALCVCLTFFCSTPVTSYALEASNGSISPRFTYISYYRLELTIDNGNARIIAELNGKSDVTESYIKCNLEKLTGSTYWMQIKSFSDTGYKSATVSESYPIEKGTYRVMGTFRCNTETQTAYSPNQTYS